MLEAGRLNKRIQDAFQVLRVDEFNVTNIRLGHFPRAFRANGDAAFRLIVVRLADSTPVDALGAGFSLVDAALRYDRGSSISTPLRLNCMLVHGLVVAFLIAFIGGHLADLRSDAYFRPLSLFRDVEPAWIGFVMLESASSVPVQWRRDSDRWNLGPFVLKV